MKRIILTALLILAGLLLLSAVETTAGGPKEILAEHELRIETLETKVGILETEVTIIDSRLDAVEATNNSQGVQLDDHEARITDLENAPPPTGGIRVTDGAGQFVGFLVGVFPKGYQTGGGIELEPHYTVFLPGPGRFAVFYARTTRGQEPLVAVRYHLQTIYYTSQDCTGQAYVLDAFDDANPVLLLSPDFVYFDKRESQYRAFTLGPVEDPGLAMQTLQMWNSDVCLRAGTSDPTIPLIEVDPGFTLPLTAPLTFE